MLHEFHPLSLLHRIPHVMRPERQQRSEEDQWRNLHSRWQQEYVIWSNPFANHRHSSYTTKVGELTLQLKAKGINFQEAGMQAEERVHLERFCEVGVVVPQAGTSRVELEALGFRFPPKDIQGASPAQRGNTWLTRYPDGWHIKPSLTDRLDSKGADRATVYDEENRPRMLIHWSDSSDGLHSHAEVLDTGANTRDLIGYPPYMVQLLAESGFYD